MTTASSLLAGAWRGTYAGYVWLSVVVVGTIVWPVVALSPSISFNWKLARAAGRMLARLAGIRLTVTGTMPGDETPYVIVANHESFIDGLVLILLRRTPVVIVAGSALATQRIAGPFLSGLGCQFVLTREDDSGLGNVNQFAAALEEGHSLAIFPEASLGAAPGLRRFHLGAFVVAANTGASVVPVGIAGSRQVVPPGRRAPQQGEVRVQIGSPIEPVCSGMPGATDLRDRAWSSVAELTGERLAGHRQEV